MDRKRQIRMQRQLAETKDFTPEQDKLLDDLMSWIGDLIKRDPEKAKELLKTL